MINVFRLIMQQAARQPVMKLVPQSIIITQQPSGFTGLQGDAFQIAIISNGTDYAFYKNDVLLSQNSTGIFTVSNSSINDSGTYYCIITDEYGQSVKSDMITVVISEKIITPDPEPNPNPNPQPASGSVWYVTSLNDNKIYSNAVLAGNTYQIYHTGTSRFLNAFEYANNAAGGFTLKQPISWGCSLIIWLTGSAVLSVDNTTSGKAYINASLNGGTYAVYRKGLNRLLAPSEYSINTAGGFTLKQAMSNVADGLVVFTAAIIVTSLANYKSYANTALSGAAYLVYREGNQRFLETYEYLPHNSGGFTLKHGLTTGERLLIFKL